MRLPDLEAWAIFASVVEHKSFSAAADAIGLSKATVSKAIARLETHVGASVFHRTSRRLALTPIGHRLAEHAARLVAEARAAEEAAHDGAVTLAGSVRLSAPMSFGLLHVAPLVAEFMARHERIEIDLHLSDATTDIVAEGFDIALRIGSLPDSSLRARRLGPVALRLVAAPAYIARYGRPGHASQLADHRLFGYTNATGPLHLTGPGDQHVTIRPSGALGTNSGEAMLPALRAGLGIAQLPDFIIGPDVQKGTLEVILPNWKGQPVAMHLLTPPGTLRPQRVEILIDFLSEKIRQVCADERL